MMEGDVVLTVIVQADGGTKNRPAVVLCEMPRFRDASVCGISAQLHHQVEGFDETISLTDEGFASSGLVAPSLIRLGFLAVLARKKLVGSIRYIGAKRHQRLLTNLSDYLLAR